MARWLPLSRAARIVGVKRGDIQKKIQQGELKVFEGEVELTELKRVFPNEPFEDKKNLEKIERLQRIKDDALNKVFTDRTLPDAETLAKRIGLLSQELAGAKRDAARNESLIYELQQRFQNITDADELIKIRDWFLDELDSQNTNDDYTDQLISSDAILRVFSATVRIKSSGHEFFVEGAESILESGLKAGFALNYGCSSGSCGLCRTRVISGEIKKIRNHDYVLSEAEKEMGYALMCSNTAVTDLVIDAGEADSVDEIPLQETQTSIRSIERPTDDIIILKVRTPRTQRLRFFAGQYVRATINDAISADLSLASCPCDDRNLAFHVPKIENNHFSEYVHSELNTNDIIKLEGPYGDFVLDEDVNRPLIFVAYDSGFAAIKGLIEHCIAMEVSDPIYLYWFSLDDKAPYLHNLCRSWADALENFSYAHHQYDPTNTSTAELERIITEHANLGIKEIYVCCPRGKIKHTEKLFSEHGIPNEQVHIEPVRNNIGD